MRVLSVVNVPPHLEVSGAANAARSLSFALNEFCQVDLVQAAPVAGHTTADGLSERRVVASNPLDPISWLVPNRVRTPFYRTDIAELVPKYDLAHLHNPIPALELRRIARACTASEVPYVVSTHGIVEVAAGGEAYGFGRLGELAWRKLIVEPFSEVVRSAALNYALSPADVDILVDMGVTNERIRIVPNGVDMPPPIRDEDLELFAIKYGLPWPKTGEPVLLFVGNHTRNKGLPILIEALANSVRPYTLIAAGSKRDHIDYAEAMASAGPDQHMIFPGFVADEDVAALFQYADLLVFPTLADTFPLVILEAMAAGLAILSTRVGGIPFQVAPECGLLVPPGDAPALGEALERLTADPVRLREMGEAGRAHVEAHFQWRTAAGSAYDGYKTLVSPQKH